MADQFLGDGTDGGTWGLSSDPNGALLVYENGDFRHVYKDLGPISNAHFVGGHDGNALIVESRDDGSLRRALLHIAGADESAAPSLRVAVADGEGATYPHVNEANWRWYGGLLVYTTGGHHWAFEDGRPVNLSRRISSRPGFVPQLKIAVNFAGRWSPEEDNDTQIRLVRYGVPSLSRMRIRRVPHSAATGFPGYPGPAYPLWKFNKQGGRATNELIPSFDEEMSSDEGHRLVRRIIVNDSHHVEIVVTFDSNDNHHVHGMGRAIADTIRIYVDMPALDTLLASGNPDDWLY